MSWSLVRVSGGQLTPTRVTHFTYPDIPDQERMTLRADIKYKSNWQQGALKGNVDF